MYNKRPEKNPMEKQEIKDEKDWAKKLTPEEYRILREKATEAPFTGEYDSFFEDGVYLCKGCGQELFESSSKFDSGCGWPAFDRAKEGVVSFTEDLSYGMRRIEVTCSSCGGHLGHIFPDGPTETGQRLCINSLSLDFKHKKTT
jgi:peptide-methionine (R)-S-oxide reductase